MAEPTLYFMYNFTGNEVAYSDTVGLEDANWKFIYPSDTIVFTGGGIVGLLGNPVASGTRDATIRPSVTSVIIPQVYIEDASLMNQVINAGSTGYTGAKQYALGVYVDGTMGSDLFLEAWDDATFSTTNLNILQGSTNNGNESCINAIRTTTGAPPPNWTGGDSGAAYLRGISDRVELKNLTSISDESVYYNIYVRLETDTPTFYETPILGFRYLYT